MARRKRALTASINNAKRARQNREDQRARAISFTEDTQRPVEDDGEIVLWGGVLVEESEEQTCHQSSID